MNRRELLKAISALGGTYLSPLALPSLGNAFGNVDTPPLRLLIIPLQHGWGFTPGTNELASGTENNFSFTGGLEPFNSIKSDCLYLEGLRGNSWGNAHDTSYTDILTAGTCYNETTTISGKINRHFIDPLTPSIDHLIAQAINTNVMRFSLGYDSWGASYHPICWDSRENPLPFHTGAQSAFDSLINTFQNIQNSSSTTTREKSLSRNALFSLLIGDASKYAAKLRGIEKDKMDTYKNAVSDFKEPTSTRTDPLSGVNLPTRPADSNIVTDSLSTYFELIKLGFMADTHRIGVIGLGSKLSTEIPNFQWTDQDGNTQNGNHHDGGFHHSVAHWNNYPDSRFIFNGYVQWYANKVLEFAQNLKSTPDFDGTSSILDNTIILLTGEVGDGPHQRGRKPHLLIGGSNYINTGRYLQLETFEPRSRNGLFYGGIDRSGNLIENSQNYGGPISKRTHAELFVTLARLMGASNIANFGIDTIFSHSNKVNMVTPLDLS